MTDLFAGEAPQENQPNPEKKEAPAPQEPANPLQELLGSIVDHEGRQKYADPATALKSIPHAETTILSLRQELREAQEQLAKATSVEELAASLGKSTPKAPAEQPSPETSEVDVAAIVQKTLADMKAAEQAAAQATSEEANAHKVRDSLLELYGEKAQEVFSKRAQDLGTTPEGLAQLARTEPQMVLSQFQPSKPSTPNPMFGNVDTSTLSKPAAPELTPPKGRTTQDMVASYREHAAALINKS